MTTAAIHQNFVRSLIIVPLSLLTNGLMGFLVVALLSRSGGFALVGHWSLLGAFTASVIACDLGVTPSLTMYFARQGSTETYPLIGSLTSIFAVAIAIVILVLVLAYLPLPLPAGAADLIRGACMALIGGAGQLMARWWLVPQLGSHRYYFLHFSLIILSTTQFAAVYIAFKSFFPSETPYTLLGACILIGSLMQFGFVMFVACLPRDDFRAWIGTRMLAPWSRAYSATKQYTLYYALSMMREPVLRFFVSALCGPAGVGLFAVSRQAPSLVRDLTSNAMQTLLPGITSLDVQGDKRGISLLTRDATLVQLIICLPLLSFFFFRAHTILSLWLGSTSNDAAMAARIFAAGLVSQCVAIPFVMALQSLRQAPMMARGLLAEITLLLSCGFFILDKSPISIVWFIALASVATVCVHLYFLTLAESGYGLLSAIRKHVNWPVVIGASAMEIAAAAALDLFPKISASQVIQLGAEAAVFGVVAAGMALLCWMYGRKPEHAEAA